MVLIFILFFCHLAGYNQYKYIFSFSSESGKLLPYVTVLWNEKNGLSANEIGVCSINSEVKIDSFNISNVGFESKVVYTNDIITKDTIKITLKETNRELPEIIVISNGVIGECGTLESKPNTFVINQTPIHFQEVVRCDIEKSVAQIIAFSVFIKKGSSNDVPLRIRIYKNGQNDLPGEDVLFESLVYM
jgi:hypothetical protein